jgi:hypothetical protein
MSTTWAQWKSTEIYVNRKQKEDKQLSSMTFYGSRPSQGIYLYLTFPFKIKKRFSDEVLPLSDSTMRKTAQRHSAKPNRHIEKIEQRRSAWR